MRGNIATVAEAVADCALVVGTTSIGHRVLEHPLRRLELGGKHDREEAGSSVRWRCCSVRRNSALSNDDMSHCHWLMRIPTREEHGSMNLGQAVARVPLRDHPQPGGREARSRKPSTPASAEDLERVTVLLEEVLEHSGYVHARVEGSTRMKIRRLIRRMNLNAHDAEVWLGMLRQILWKLVS